MTCVHIRVLLYLKKLMPALDRSFHGFCFVDENCLVKMIVFSTFRTPRGLEDVSQYPELFATLLASGMWTIDDLKKLAGLNFLRVFKEVERVGIF